MSLKLSRPYRYTTALERVAGIEPASSAWKAEVIATIRHPLIPFTNSLKAPPLIEPGSREEDYKIHPCILPCGPRCARSKLLPAPFPHISGVEPALRAWSIILTTLQYISQRRPAGSALGNMVEGGGFEPPKAEPADLQSAPFDRSGIPPKIKASILYTPLCHVNKEQGKSGHETASFAGFMPAITCQLFFRRFTLSCFLDDLIGNVLRARHVILEFHGELATTRSHGAQITDVTKHF